MRTQALLLGIAAVASAIPAPQRDSKTLKERTDFPVDVTKYAYETCTFTSESREPGCGFCQDSRDWTTALSSPELDCSKLKPADASIMSVSRTRHGTCWVKTTASKRDALEVPENIEHKEIIGFDEQIAASLQPEPTKVVARGLGPQQSPFGPKVTRINHQVPTRMEHGMDCYVAVVDDDELIGRSNPQLERHPHLPQTLGTPSPSVDVIADDDNIPLATRASAAQVSPIPAIPQRVAARGKPTPTKEARDELSFHIVLTEQCLVGPGKKSPFPPT
ncbi:hypothetical protein CC86DRAFT_407228 [Ophiobolus disseminans]|uniref:Uncharacterized protein n=1 Tax=Ophiobolus disseminans TaxID=1469910 RepID=A0A6A6ZY50_9PLEO|nr:hypothetical protein CC86DRAFT_407228 [Ophiobolus disseminans]